MTILFSQLARLRAAKTPAGAGLSRGQHTDSGTGRILANKGGTEPGVAVNAGEAVQQVTIEPAQLAGVFALARARDLPEFSRDQRPNGQQGFRTEEGKVERDRPTTRKAISVDHWAALAIADCEGGLGFHAMRDCGLWIVDCGLDLDLGLGLAIGIGFRQFGLAIADW